jgi:hypothetical protein
MAAAYHTSAFRRFVGLAIRLMCPSNDILSCVDEAQNGNAEE